MLDGRVAIRRGDRAKDEARESIASAQVFVVSFGVDSCRLRQTGLFAGAELKSQSINDALCNFVLHRDDVMRRCVHAIAPDNFTAAHVE